jgi:DNA repair protein RadC
MSLKNLPPDSRPRERLLGQGAAALSDAELIALLLRTGYQGMPVLDLAQQVLAHFGGISGLLNASVSSLSAIKGLGPAKRAELICVMELSRRAVAAQLGQAPVFDNPASVKAFAQMKLAHLNHEVFAVLFLDTQHRLIEWQDMFRGTLSQASVYPREVARLALQLHAAAVILVHNHPSGVAEPSLADEKLTHTLRDALALLDVRVLDHLVVGRGCVCSMAERGLV